jgi:alkanesulfonate monooxygenase
MNNTTVRPRIEVFTTCPFALDMGGDGHLRTVAEVAHWSEACGCKGILVYTDNSRLDPWLISQVILENTTTLCPLVAVQPVYMHPYTVAKMVASFGYLYRRRLYLNMVAGGFKNDLAALDDTTPHDKRYHRLVEYTTIIKELLASPAPVTYEGEFYRVNKLRLTPPLPADLAPGVFISGSSEDGLRAARQVGATAIMYPKPAAEYEGSRPVETFESGVRVGIIARPDAEQAWQIAHERFPEDRKGQLTHQLAIKTSDSVWHQQLSDMGKEPANGSSPYWLVPFQNYKTFCPYLVGSYQQVADELARYIALGHRTFILDIPPNEDEIYHTNRAFQLTGGMRN